MKPEILVMARSRPLVEEQLGQDFQLHRRWEMADPEAGIAAVADRIRAIVTTGEIGASAELIGRLPQLEIIACFGVGVDAVDLDAARAQGIPVTNTPDVLTDDVADMAMVLMLMVLRRILPADRYVREGRWAKEGPFGFGTRPMGKRLGIVGLGRIGKALAKRATAAGMEIAYCGRREQPDQPYRCYRDVVALAEAVDVLALCTPGGTGTRHLVDARVLEALGPKGYLVNVARGSVVDEGALVRALAEGRIAGAGLDVFEREPEVPEALLTMDNVVLQPHQASATVETRDAMGQLVVDNIRAHFAGRPLISPFPL